MIIWHHQKIKVKVFASTLPTSLVVVHLVEPGPLTLVVVVVAS